MSINSQLSSLLSSVGVVNISSTTASSSTSTGALIVAGGTGIAGNLYVGGQIISAGGTISNSILNYTSFSVTTTAITQIGSFSISQYRSAKFIIQISDDTTSFQISEILLLAISAGTTAGTGVTSIAEYAVLTSDAVLGDFSADIQSDGIVRLYLTPYSATNKTVNVSVQLMGT
jgi:hypothetical protein